MRAMRIDWVVLGAAALASVAAAPPAQEPVVVKVMVIAPTSEEIAPWVARYGLDTAITIPGLWPGFPAVQCNGDGVCAVATGPGKASAAATITAIAINGQVDLSASYFLIADLARIDPARGTIGSVV